jgi:hypothetical protein
VGEQVLPRKLPAETPEAERLRWRAIRLDTHVELNGLILSADCDTGQCVMRVRGPDQIAGDGTRTPGYRTVDYNLGPGGLALIGK